MVQLDLNLKHTSASHTCTHFVTPVKYFKKISCVCRHLHENFACNARTLIAVIAVIAMSSSKLYHTIDTRHNIGNASVNGNYPRFTCP